MTGLFDLRTWTLRRRIAALCLAVGVILSGLGVLAAVTATAHNNQLDDALDRATPMRAAGETLNTALVNQETGIRGYAISGRESNLEPYERGRAEEGQQMARIEGLLKPGDQQIRAALGTVRQRIAVWRSEVAEPVLRAVRADGPAAGQALVDASNSSHFDALRTSVEAMQDRIQEMRDRSATAARESSQTMVAIEVVAAIVIVLSGAALLVLLDRLVSRPVTELAGQVREVANGDYERAIVSPRGSPDLVRLAADVDGMRRQIAAELSEVRVARQQVEWINDQLKSQAEELTRSNRDLEQFAYVASHDLQEPLRKVASFCQLLQRRYAGQLDERADQYITFAVDGAQRMQRLINDLLAFSRIGRLTNGFNDVDLGKVLTDVNSQLEARMADTGGEIVWSALPTVEGEEPLLTTLFVNLIGNSLKFRRPDVPPVVRVSAERDDGQWRITVRDNGIGIEREFADKVFVIFQRLHARDAYEGTGIGLAIVKKIVEYHGGRIWLDLDVPEGTSINFTLPIPVGYEEHAPEPEREEGKV